MKMLMVLLLLVLTGCATSDEYRENAFKPKPNKIRCPDGQVAVVEKWVKNEQWQCVDEDALMDSMEMEMDYEE